MHTVRSRCVPALAAKAVRVDARHDWPLAGQREEPDHLHHHGAPGPGLFAAPIALVRYQHPAENGSGPDRGRLRANTPDPPRPRDTLSALVATLGRDGLLMSYDYQSISADVKLGDGVR